MAQEGITAGGVMDLNTALQEALKAALIHDGLARGIREAAKALEKCCPHPRVLSPTVMSLPMWLVKALGAEHQITQIKVDDKKPGEGVGHCKTDRENP
nr:40S ribosomal protein S12-like [Macaca fascicularis]